MNEMNKWQGRIEERVKSISEDVKTLKDDFENHLKEHAKSLKETTNKWFWICICLIGGIFSLIGFILRSIS